jgi:hypothetical protein
MENLTDLSILATNTVEQYYSMTKEQRDFITMTINANKEDHSWTRPELMKVLILYNAAIQNNCSVHDKLLDNFTKMIDEKSDLINTLLINYDNVFRSRRLNNA